MVSAHNAVFVLFVFLLAVPKLTAASPTSAFLEKHCKACHTGERAKGEFRIDNLDLSKITRDNADRWRAIANRIVLGEMPPPARPKPPAADRDAVVDWVSRELAKAGLALPDAVRKLQLPGHGNRIDHDQLFDAGAKTLASTPARIWRINSPIYGTFTRSLARGSDLPSPFAVPASENFKDFAALYGIDEACIGQLLRNAEAVVEMQTGKSMAPEFAPLFKSELTQVQLETAIRKHFQLVLRREPTKDELGRHVIHITKLRKECGVEVGSRAGLATILLLPEALYRMEIGAGEPDSAGRRMLAPRELARAIGFALSDSGPDNTLLQAADQGKLKTRDDVIREVRRLLDDVRFEKARIPRFFDEYFQFPHAEDVFKDFVFDRPELYVREFVLATRLLIKHVLDEDKNVFEELLTTNKSFVNVGYVKPNGQLIRGLKFNRPLSQEELDRLKARGWPMPKWKPEIHEFYGLPRDWEWTDKQPIELNPKERAGILTQPSWLWAYASNDNTDAIRRGKWIREKLLGGVVPDVPITVDARLPQDETLTMREKLRVTQKEYCWQCHKLMNPLGLAFENYDYMGRFRSEIKVLDRVATDAQILKKPTDKRPKIMKAVPVDCTGQIEQSGVPGLDGPVPDAISLIKKLAKTDRARQVFIRHAFRYWMGRNETLSDAPTLVAADHAYRTSGGSMKALILSLLTSDSFLYRTLPTQK